MDQDIFINLTNNSNELVDNYSFLFNNRFGIKIFDLINSLKEYNLNKYIKIYNFMDFLREEENNLHNIIQNLPLISYENKNAYLATYYYYILIKLLNCFLYYENEKCPDFHNQKKIMEEILQKKKEKIINKLNQLNKDYEKQFSKECKNSDDKEIMNIFTLKIVAADRYGDEIKKLQSKYNKIINILKRNDSYFSNFFQTYLPILSSFLNKIPKTLYYLNKKILNNSFENLKSDLEEFDYFIFYIFNYDFVKNMDKINEIACSFEDFFIKEKNIIINEKIGDFKFNNNENILIQTDPCSHKIRLKDYNNYCFELIKKEKLKVNRYLNEQFFLFFKYQANNAFEKNKSVYKDFFKKIFKNNTIKNLFIYIFPYLEKNYFIDDDFIEQIFMKIKSFNFKPIDLLAETVSPVMNIYIKGYFEGDDNLESEICYSSTIIILILHELAHYIRIYIFKKTGKKKYKKSFDLCHEDEIGVYLEKLLFGSEIKFINFYQAIFLLNIENYSLDYNLFCENFKKLDNYNNSNYENFAKDLQNSQDFLIKLGIDISDYKFSSKSIIFPIKGGKGYLLLGVNKDKRCRPINIEEIFKGTGFECLLKEK